MVAPFAAPTPTPSDPPGEKKTRRQRRKAKVAGTEPTGPTPTATPDDPPGEKKKKRPRRKKQTKKSVGKVHGQFQCTNEDCRKKWTSAHAWTSHKIFCEKCNGNAKILDFANEVINYSNRQMIIANSSICKLL